MPATKKYKKPRPSIPAAVKREVQVKARHSCVICHEQAVTDLHHIDENRQNNSADNLACLCPNHHRLVHKGKYTRPELREYVKNADELGKLRDELNAIKGTMSISLSPEYLQVRGEYQTEANSLADNLLFYQAFVYLTDGIYLDEKGTTLRAVIVEALSISQETEAMIIETLLRLGKFEQVGSLVVLKDNADARAALSELISQRKFNIDTLMSMLDQV